MFWRRGGNNQPQSSSLDQHVSSVENILLQLQVDPRQARIDTSQGYGWSFQRGSALIEVYITLQGDREFLQVLSPIMHLPMSGLLPLYRRMLELNLQLTNASLGVYLDVVYVFNERPLNDMDASEANYIINMISSYADEIDDQLVREFGGRLYGQAK